MKQRKKDSDKITSEILNERDSDISQSTKKSKKTKVKRETPNSSTEPIVKIDFKRIVVRCLGIMGVIYFLSYMQSGNMETFVSQKEEVQKKHFTVTCSQDYANEIKKFPGCVPKKCGRFVSDAVVSPDEVQVLMMIAEKGLSLGGSDGGASILDLHSGALSKGEAFVNIYSLDKKHQIITSVDLEMYSRIKNKIKSAIVSHFGLNANRLYLTHPTFISRINSVPAKTIHDEYWHPHVDKETYQSFHYTSLLYLTDYGRHFSGGRFVFIDQDSNKTVEPRIGRLSAFTSGSENLHYVEKVSGGTRYAITVSFTCDPKQSIKDPKFES